MPTDNRRVAAYLPKSIDEKFEAFKLDRDLGDSQALITILSEFLGVTHQVNDSSLDYFERLLEKRINKLKGELKSELLTELQVNVKLPIITDLPNELLSSKENNISELSSELLSSKENETSKLLSELVVNKEDNISGLSSELIDSSESDLPQTTNSLQLDLTDLEDKELNKPLSDLLSESLQSMNETALNKRFSLADRSVSKARSRYKTNVEKFTDWTKTKDPDGIAWEFREEEKLYYPIYSGI